MPPEVESVATADLLGHVVAWQFPTNQVSYADVRTALELAGLDPDAAKELRPAAAVTIPQINDEPF
jgi:ABC-type nitrate/sulfonate/bicarbonate transport system substrate-binding protein